jgi:hypothetical protein
VNEASARKIVRERADGRCEACCSSRDLEWSHRIARGRGGLWAPTNGLLLCRRDHAWAHAHPNHARALGWHVLTGDDPAAIPVWMQSIQFAWTAWFRLDDEGLVTWLTDDNEPEHLPEGMPRVSEAFA